MVGNGAQSGALSPFAPTGIIVNGLMNKIGLAGHEWRTYWTNLAAHAIVAFVGYFALGGWRLFTRRYVGASEDAGANERLSRAHWLTLGVVSCVLVAVLFFEANIGMAAFAGAVLLAASWGRRSRSGDPPNAVDADPDGQRRQRAGRAAREDEGARPVLVAPGAARDIRVGDRRDRVRHRRHLGLQQHVGRRAACVSADGARPGCSDSAAIRSASPRR